ncbi:phage N-6-adenine-methyltransferase [Pectobacterium versatile]|uniref:phage N-6-adenine-methyltransferase n=1 Tax=Pectobacterium versatile TaxID=2488639 RepID=UPI0032EFA487
MSYHDSTTPKESRDTWCTPPEIYAALDREFHFVGDVAASDTNHLHLTYLTEKDDALSPETPWGFAFHDGYVWCNPPYSDIMPWVKKAQQDDCDGVGVVMLVPADVLVGWFRRALIDVSEVRFITGGRLAFINPETGKPAGGGRMGSMLLIWNRQRPGTRPFTTAARDDLMSYGSYLLSSIRSAT